MGTVSNSEYISHDAVDTQLLAMEERFIDNPFALTAIAMAMNEIDKITASNVAPVVHGRWEVVYNSVGKQEGQCTHCGKNSGILITKKVILPELRRENGRKRGEWQCLTKQ
jgi:hypothetical protein